MTSWLLKYGAFIYLINTMLFSVFGLHWAAQFIFISLMVLGGVLLITSPKFFKHIILSKSFRFYFILNIINLSYYFIFEIGELESFKYLISRFVGVTLFSASIYANEKFYEEQFFNWIVNFLFLLSIVGFILNIPSFGRYAGLFGNYNEFGVLMSFAFGFKYLMTKHKVKKDWLLLFFLGMMVVLSGSRGAIVGIVISIFLADKNFIRSMLVASALIVFFYSISTFVGVENSFARLSSEESLLFNRIYEYEYAVLTFKEKWLEGYGLSYYAYIDNSLIGVEHYDKTIGAHNGYLAILTQYGLIFSFFFFLNLIYGLRYVAPYVKEQWGKPYVKVCLFVLIYTFFYSVFETVMTGINNFHTAMFWFVLGLLYYKSYHLKTHTE